MQCGHRYVFPLRLLPFLLLLLQASASSASSVQVSLRGMDAAVETGSGENVNILSDDLQNLLSNIEQQRPTDLTDPAEPIASAPEKEEESQDEGEATPPEFGERSVEDGAMAKIKASLSASESKNAELKQQTAEEEYTRSSLQERMEFLQKQVEAAEALGSAGQRQNSTSLAQLQDKLATEVQRTSALEQKLSILSHESDLREEAKKKLGDAADSQARAAETIKVKINLAAQKRIELQERLRHLKVGSKTSLLAQRQMSVTSSREQAAIEQQLRKTLDGKQAEDEQIAVLERRRNFLRHRQTLLAKPEKRLQDVNQLLKVQVGKELKHEEQIQQMLNNKKVFLQIQGNRDRDSRMSTEVARVRAATENLHLESQRLGEMIFTIEMAKHGADMKRQGLQAATAAKEDENRQLQERTLPLLEYRVNQQLQAAKATTKMLQEASNEREAVRAELDGVQRDIVQAQDRYAQVLQAVVAQSGESQYRSSKHNMLRETRQANQYARRQHDQYANNFYPAPAYEGYNLQRQQGLYADTVRDPQPVQLYVSYASPLEQQRPQQIYAPV